MRYPFQSLRATNKEYAGALQEAASRVIRSGWYLNGAEKEALEEEFCRNIGVAHSVGVGCGLDALRLIFRAYMETGRLRKGDAVAVQGNTFIASVLPLTELGLRLHLTEPDETTYAASFEHLKRAADTDAGVKAVVAVHLYGTPNWDFGIAEEFRRRGILIIEDACQAIGSGLRHPATGEFLSAGALGDAAAFSFYPGKNLGALGDGGMVATNDAGIASLTRSLANYGSEVKYRHDHCGYNSRLDELQAAFLRVKLPFVARETERRNAAARAYSETLRLPELLLPAHVEGMRQSWHQYVVRHPHREMLMERLLQEGVETMVHYPVAIHRQPCYARELGGVSLPFTEKLAREVISLPIANITAEEAAEIAGIINGN